MTDMLEEQVKEIAEAVNNDENKKAARVQDMETRVKDVYDVLKCVVKGNNVNIKYDLHEPYESMGAVTIVGNEITVEDPVAFAKAVAVASNVEIYPKVDGTVQIDFTFHGLTRKMEG